MGAGGGGLVLIELAGDDFLFSWSGYRILRISCSAEVGFCVNNFQFAFKENSPSGGGDIVRSKWDLN